MLCIAFQCFASLSINFCALIANKRRPTENQPLVGSFHRRDCFLLMQTAIWHQKRKEGHVNSGGCQVTISVAITVAAQCQTASPNPASKSAASAIYISQSIQSQLTQNTKDAHKSSIASRQCALVLVHETNAGPASFYGSLSSDSF